MRKQLTVLVLALLGTSSSVAALAAAPIPEPGVVELLAIGGIAGLVVALRNRRK